MWEVAKEKSLCRGQSRARSAPPYSPGLDHIFQSTANIFSHCAARVQDPIAARLFRISSLLHHVLLDRLILLSSPTHRMSTAQRAHYSPPWANTSLIGVAGSSGSGKTTLSLAIISALNLPWVVILSMVGLDCTPSTSPACLPDCSPGLILQAVDPRAVGQGFQKRI